MNPELGGARDCGSEFFRIVRWGERPREPFPALARQESRPTGAAVSVTAAPSGGGEHPMVRSHGWPDIPNMSTQTLLIIVVLVLLFGGGGFYFSRRGR